MCLQLILNQKVFADGIIEVSDLCSSESLSVLFAVTTGGILDAHAAYWVQHIYQKDPKTRYEPWRCGGMLWTKIWERINDELQL